MANEEVPPEQLPQVAEQVDASAIRHFISVIKSAEQQVGEHIVAALQDPTSVAVLTTVVMGPDGNQRIVSAGLDPEMLGLVQQVLAQAQAQREEEIPCVGFHCYVKKKAES